MEQILIHSLFSTILTLLETVLLTNTSLTVGLSIITHIHSNRTSLCNVTVVTRDAKARLKEFSSQQDGCIGYVKAVKYGSKANASTPETFEHHKSTTTRPVAKKKKCELD